MKSKYNLIAIVALLIVTIYLTLSDQEIWLIPFIIFLVVISIVGKKYQKFWEAHPWRFVLLQVSLWLVIGIGSYILITKVFGVHSLF